MLAQGLVENDACGHCQVEATDAGVGHGDGVGAIGIEPQDLVWQSLGLLAKHKMVAGPEPALPKGLLGLFAEKKKPFFVLGLEIGVEVRPVPDGNVGPIIESGPFQVPIVGGESQGVDEMEHRVRRPAQPGDGAGVGRDLRFDQHDVERRRGRGGHGRPRARLEKRDIVLS